MNWEAATKIGRKRRQDQAQVISIQKSKSTIDSEIHGSISGHTGVESSTEYRIPVAKSPPTTVPGFDLRGLE